MNQQEPARRPTPTRRAGRSGYILAAAVVALVLLTMIMTNLTRSLVTQAKLERSRRHHRQAAWLAESGVRRALARYAANPEYSGERWRIPEALLAEGGEVTIELHTAADAATELRVLARYPLDSPTAATVEIKHDLPPSSSREQP